VALSPLRLTAALLAALTCASAAAAQESVQTAQALYASASYDEALAVLDRLKEQPLSPSEVLTMHQQRALCLLALGRPKDADTAIAAVVEADPTYRPDASPRVRQAFRDVRARVLPRVVRAEYAEGRRLYDAGDWDGALARLQRALLLVADPDLAEGERAELADLKVLAEGFATLALKASMPPPPAEEPAPAPEPAPEPPAPEVPAVDYDRLFDGTEAGVVAPVTIRQDLPRWTHGTMQVPRAPGLLEVVVGKDGLVESATMKQRIASFYDRLVLDAVLAWRYQPAHLDGRPVRFRKTIKISFR
jgi:tetratricopeptide (TPR) repeat protein